MTALLTVAGFRQQLSERPGRPLGTLSYTPGKHAAVAAILRDTSIGIQVLLIRRADRDGDPWSGHMALPGGRHDPTDASLLHTAVRETEEELGLSLDSHHLLGPLDDLEAVARGRPVGMVIRPYVFHWTASEPPQLRPNEEVAEALWAPLLPMKTGEWNTHRPYQMGDLTYKLPAWDVHGRVVWGLTHRILSDLLERI